MKTMTKTYLHIKTIIVMTLCLALHALACHAQTRQSVDSLLRCIDKAVDNSSAYVAKRERRIGKLRRDLAKATTDSERYRVAFALYGQYAPFVNDSAVYFLDRCVTIASRMKGREADVCACRALIAMRHSSTGIYVESLKTLSDIDTANVSSLAKGMYFQAYTHVYGEMAYYSHVAATKALYEEIQARYRARMYANLPATDNAVFQYRQLQALNSGDWRKALRVNDGWMRHVREGSYPYALVTLYRYLAYKLDNDSTRMMYWLAQSVLSDIRNGVLDQGSMWEMANQLMVTNNVDRAYKYISYTCYCATRFGSRQRLAQIAPLLADIARKYKTENDRYNRQQNIALGVISVLAVVLLFGFFYVVRQRQKLAVARDDLATSNRQLQEFNVRLESLNGQLKAANARLSAVNKELSDANRVKEEYVGLFMRLCSDYINKIEALRKKVNNKVKTRQYAELYEMTRPKGDKEELEAFYANFDSAFLHLFPHFFESFNALLRPEERIERPERDRLTTPVRIFALIRLGITDSGKIAEFLHYSVNTIYNYRAHIKKGAINDKETFEDDIRKIGTF